MLSIKKDPSEIVALVADYGSFESLAVKLSETFAKVYYNTPSNSEFHDLKECVKGDGVPGIERVDGIITSETMKEVDLFIFPDIGYGGEQEYLRNDCGKLVWGSMGADEYELYRTRFLKLVKDLGLAVPISKTIRGLTALREHLREVKDKWVKINRYRANRETFHHIDYAHSLSILDDMAVQFGGMQEYVIFVVQDPITHAQEIGYDFLSVDGQWPDSAFSGYEGKNECYLGSLLDYEKLPEQVREVNEALTPLLRDYQYRNFIATEIRSKDGVPHYIDPTNRMPGQTGEQLLETCTNLAEMILRGSTGELIKPEWAAKFAAEVTLHYKDCPDNGWKVMRIPEKVEQWVKLYHYSRTEDGLFHFPPHGTDEVGIVMGLGDTIEESIQHLKDNLELLKDEPVSAKLDGFVDLIKEIDKAEEAGMEFTDQQIPEPEIVIK